MARRGKNKGRNISGILLLDKPSGITSNHALQRVKRIFFAAKAGHTGTLDPLASGMLPICFGAATRLSHYLINSDKAYRVKAKLGEVTDTLDADGKIVEQALATHVNQNLVESIASQFIGKQQQIPPMYSALKYNGQRLYELARAGVEVERKARNIEVFNIAVLNVVEGESIELEVHCSKGTYIRSLIDDMARKMNTLATLIELRRLWVNPFSARPMLTLGEVEEMTNEERACAILPPDTGLEFMPCVEVSSASAIELTFGRPVASPETKTGQYRIYRDDGLFLGVGDSHHAELSPKRLMFNQDTLIKPQVE